MIKTLNYILYFAYGIINSRYRKSFTLGEFVGRVLRSLMRAVIMNSQILFAEIIIVQVKHKEFFRDNIVLSKGAQIVDVL